MPVTTWSFNSGFNGWTFEEQLNLGVNPCTGCSATRTHVIGAIRTTLVLASLPNVTVAGLHTSPTELNAAIQNGDTIEADVSATSDAPNQTQTRIVATYTDETTETVTSTGSAAETVTLTLTQNKTLDFITVRTLRATSGSASGSTHSRDIEEVRLTTSTALTATAGKLRTPQSFIEDEGAGAAGGAGGGAGGNIADISADGLYIYIASFNNLGFPTLIKILAALSADGSVVFDPGAGGRIGVQCGKLNADTVWTAGVFDGTNTVEKSEDAGSSFTVKDDGSFGAIRTFQVGPGNDERVLLFDGDNGDIIETLDDGVSWTDINTAVTQLINSLPRFDVNLQEIVAANQGAANNSINYSPNTGVDLEDYQTGVYPNANATKAIVK